jgi:hypothetical protein
MPKKKEGSDKGKRKPPEKKDKPKHGDVVDIPIEQIRPNDWNPSEMSAAEFDMLTTNISDVGFLQPIVVVPVQEDDGLFYRIIDGEHRYEAQRLHDAEAVKCVIASDEILDEDQQRFQTIRMNQIRGSINPDKFVRLVNELADSGRYSLDELGINFGFVDQDAFQALLDDTRKSLPKEARKEFDKARPEITSGDELSNLLTRLFRKYGSTLPANYMILDVGGRESMWVRLSPDDWKRIRRIASAVLKEGVTFDSYLLAVLLQTPLDKVPADVLVPISKDTSIDDLLGRPE